jgi:mRNA-degrading endonuclease toxin of MazEF toxin-antitoxin module
VKVDFPFDENPATRKIRPALALTPPTGKYRLVVLAFITSRTDEVLTTDVMLQQQESDFDSTKLARTSVVKLHKLASVGEHQILGEIGILPQKWESQVKDNLRHLLEL